MENIATYFANLKWDKILLFLVILVLGVGLSLYLYFNVWEPMMMKAKAPKTPVAGADQPDMPAVA